MVIAVRQIDSAAQRVVTHWRTVSAPRSETLADKAETWAA